MEIKKVYEIIRVTEVPLDDHQDHVSYNHEINTTLVDLLVFMAGMPLKDQIYMLANTLTVSGFTQKEIAGAMGVTHQAYRHRLLNIRKDFEQRDVPTLK